MAPEEMPAKFAVEKFAPVKSAAPNDTLANTPEKVKFDKFAPRNEVLTKLVVAKEEPLKFAKSNFAEVTCKAGNFVLVKSQFAQFTFDKSRFVKSAPERFMAGPIRYPPNNFQVGGRLGV